MTPTWYHEADDYQTNTARLREQLKTWRTEIVEVDPGLYTQVYYPTIWIYPIVPCPYCGLPCECDMVNVGVGLVQCGPYYCDCGASEIGPEEGVEKTAVEKLCGWYEPGKPPSPLANTVGGLLVDHQTAKTMYELGLLDAKE
jgi:hypothetical protein